jgi:hypothetical protein
MRGPALDREEALEQLAAAAEDVAVESVQAEEAEDAAAACLKKCRGSSRG